MRVPLAKEPAARAGSFQGGGSAGRTVAVDPWRVVDSVMLLAALRRSLPARPGEEQEKDRTEHDPRKPHGPAKAVPSNHTVNEP